MKYPKELINEFVKIILDFENKVESLEYLLKEKDAKIAEMNAELDKIFD